MGGVGGGLGDEGGRFTFARSPWVSQRLTQGVLANLKVGRVRGGSNLCKHWLTS